MDENRKKRLQIFLTIMDTIHDFGDDGRYDDSFTNDKIKPKVLYSLMDFFNEACYEEMRILGNTHLNFRQIKDLYRSFYARKMKIPSDYQIRVKNIVFDILEEFYDISVEIVHQANINNEGIYTTFRSFYDTQFIKYVLDKNRSDNKLFCLDPKHVKTITKTSIVSNSPLLKTILVGKFSEYDNQKISKHITTYKNISSFFHIENSNSEEGNDETFENPCILSKELYDYEISREANELLFLDIVGVNHQTIYHIIHSKQYKIELRYFSNRSTTGLPLFIQAFIAKERRNNANGHYSIEDLEKETLTAIAKVFKISCNWFDVREIAKHIKQDITYLNADDYVLALYDLKRAMDYLQVKACIAANNKNIFEDTKVTFVSSDRLAVLYAMINECPTILTRYDTDVKDTLLEAYRVDKKQSTSGGMLKMLSPQSYVRHIDNKTDDDSNITRDDVVYFKDIIKQRDNSYFQQFLRRYKEVSKAEHMPFIWYITYKTLFYFL